MTPTLDQPSTPVGLGPTSRAPSLSGALSDDGGAQPLIDPGLPWLVVAVVAAVLLRVGLLWLGPMTEPARSLDLVPADRQALATTLLDEGWYAVPSQIEEPESVSRALEAVGLDAEPSTPPPTGLRHERYHLPGPTAVSTTLRVGTADERVWPIAQATLSVLTVLLAFVAVSLVWGRAAGAVAAWAMALSPALVIDPLAMQPLVVPLLLVLAAVALLADRRAGALNGVLSGGCVGLAGLFALPMLILAPVLAGWVVLHQRKLAGVVTGVLTLVAAGAPIAAWTARGVALGIGPLPTVAPIVGVLEADAAVSEAVAAQTPTDPLEERPFGPTAAPVNLSQAPAGTDGHDASAWIDAPVVDALARLLEHPAETSRYLLGRVAAPFIHDRSDALHALLGLTPPDGSSIERWLAGDFLLTQSPAPLADAMALTTLAASGAMVALVPFGLAIAAWRRRWSGLLLVAGLVVAAPLAALFTPDPEQLLPISLFALALAASGLAARRKPRALNPTRPRRRRAKPSANPIETAKDNDGPVLSRLTSPAEPSTPEPPVPLAPTAIEPADGPDAAPRDDADDEPAGGLRLPKLPSVDRLAAAYDVPEEEAPGEVLPRKTGRPL